MRILSVMAVMVLALAFGVACSSGAEGREIAVEAGAGGGKLFFKPDKVTVKAGEKVVFVVKNTDSQDHEFESDAGIAETALPAGQTRKIAWTAPDKAGKVEIWCDKPGHKAAGLVMEVTVQ
jgi:uncharacterized cupredoxin-like copper-binding protein